MATLKLNISSEDGRYTLMENGEQYEQLWRFRDAAEARSHLARLDIDEAQLAELWAGQEVELAEGLVWPTQGKPERVQQPAHPAAFDQSHPEQRTGRGR